MKSHLRVRQTGSTIGTVEHMRKIIKGLGLCGPGSHVVVANTPSFRGMVKKVIHLVTVEEVDHHTKPAAGAAAAKKAKA